MVVCQGEHGMKLSELEYFQSTHLLDVGVLRCDLDLDRFSESETVSLRLSFGRRSFETSKKAISNILDWNEKVCY